MDLNRLEDGKQKDKYFEDEDDDAWCGEVEFSPAKQTRVDEEEYWDESDDSWCHEMALPSPKRARLEEEGEEQVGGAGPLFSLRCEGVRFRDDGRTWSTRRVTRLVWSN